MIPPRQDWSSEDGSEKACCESGGLQRSSKIKPSHVEAVLQKLRAKLSELEVEIAAATSADKKARLEGELGIARTHIQRAE